MCNLMNISSDIQYVAYIKGISFYCKIYKNNHNVGF